MDQLWQFHEGRFVLVDERRSGGTPLGIFVEAGEEVHPYLPGLAAYRDAHEIGKDEDGKRRGKRRRKRGAEERPQQPSGPASAAARALDAPPSGDR